MSLAIKLEKKEQNHKIAKKENTLQMQTNCLFIKIFCEPKVQPWFKNKTKE